MIYKKFQDLELSALGMGAMRLPVLNGDDSRIDEDASEKIVACAMERGINYYDTAWGYHGGQSEIVLGKILAAYPEKAFTLPVNFLVTIFPIWIKSRRYLRNN